MKTGILPGGLWPVMLTPFQENNTIDTTGLEELTRFYMNAGADGLFANCLSSEMFQLTDCERITIIETVVKSSNKNVPVIATGTFSLIEKNTIDFIKKVSDLGVDAVVINSNQLTDSQADEDTFKRKLETLIKHTGDIPLGIYECPVPYKRLLSPVLMKWLAQTGRFFYFKDTSCDMKSIEQKLMAINGSPLGLYNANMPTGLESLLKGAKGLTPIGANFFPEIYSYLIKNHKVPEKEKIIKRLNTILSAIDPLVHCYYPFSAKLILHKRGLKIKPTTRIPIESMGSQDIIKFNDLLSVFQQLAEEVGQPEAI